MSLFAMVSLLVTVGALFSFVSHRFLRLPTTVGTMILSLGAAAVLIATGELAPALHIAAEHLVGRVDFNQVVLHGMLAFLLFAAALQLDLSQLSRERVPIFVLSTVATALSTVLVALVFREALHLAGTELPLATALLFGALISPTDPVAVLDVLRRAGAPVQLKSQLAGESLFNDGVGAVLFLALRGASAHGALPSPSRFGILLLLEAGGGIALGLALGYLTYRMLRMVNSYRVEVLLTLALAMGGYALADGLHLSAPLEAVTAGLLVSGRGRAHALTPDSEEHIDRFWELIDKLLNIVLFLLLGLQILVLPFTLRHLVFGLIAIPVVLLARFFSAGLCLHTLALFRRRIPGATRVLTWGGLRGGLAVALALSLPGDPGSNRNLLLIATFVVVIFSIVVQGLSLPLLLRKLSFADPTLPELKKELIAS